MAENQDLAHLHDEWNEIASLDALWAISSKPERKFNRWEIGDFFDSGANQVEGLLEICQARQKPRAYGSALDFGCGVGRLTQHLAGHFEAVIGVDISEEMVSRARSLLHNAQNVTYEVNPFPDLRMFPDRTFDFISSIFVLQHLPSTALAATYLREFVRVLRPDGIALVQLPHRLPTLRFVLARRTPYIVLRRLGVTPRFLYQRLGLHPMHMISLSTRRVQDIVHNAGGSAVEPIQIDKQDTLYAITPKA